MHTITFRSIRFRFLIALVCIALLGQGIVLKPALAKKADAPNQSSVGFFPNPGGPWNRKLATVSWSNPQVVFVFGIANDRTIRVRTMDGNQTWSSWTNLGKDPKRRGFESIRAVAWQGHVSLFARDGSYDLWHRGYSPYAGWGAWENLGGSGYAGTFSSGNDIEVVSWAPGRIDVFSNTSVDLTYHKWFDGTNWWPGTTWEPLYFRIGSVVSWGPNRIDTVAKKASLGVRYLYHNYTNGDGLWWPGGNGNGNGEDMNFTPSINDPLLLSSGSNRLDIFANNTDLPAYNTMYKAWTGSGWTGWTNIGNAVPGNCPWVSGVSWGPDRFDIFEVCSGNAPGVYHKGHQNNVWYPSVTGWEYVGGEAALHQVEVTSWGPNRLDIFAIRDDGSMWHLAWGNSGWWPSVNSWEYLGSA